MYVRVYIQGASRGLNSDLALGSRSGETSGQNLILSVVPRRRCCLFKSYFKAMCNVHLVQFFFAVYGISKSLFQYFFVQNLIIVRQNKLGTYLNSN